MGAHMLPRTLKVKAVLFDLGGTLVYQQPYEPFQRILPRAGLEEFFDVCVGFDTTGKRKPSPEAFKHALRRLDVKPEEAIFVGDNLEQDYLGAQKVGMKALLIQREGKSAAGVKTIASLEEIFDVL